MKYIILLIFLLPSTVAHAQKWQEIYFKRKLVAAKHLARDNPSYFDISSLLSKRDYKIWKLIGDSVLHLFNTQEVRFGGLIYDLHSDGTFKSGEPFKMGGYSLLVFSAVDDPIKSSGLFRFSNKNELYKKLRRYYSNAHLDDNARLEFILPIMVCITPTAQVIEYTQNGLLPERFASSSTITLDRVVFEDGYIKLEGTVQSVSTYREHYD